MFENPRRGRQARNFTTNAPKILDLKSSSEQIFSRKLPLGAPVPFMFSRNVNDQSLGIICNFHMTICFAGKWGWGMLPDASHKEPIRSIRNLKSNFSRQKTIKIAPGVKFLFRRGSTPASTENRPKSVRFFIINVLLVIKNTF